MIPQSANFALVPHGQIVSSLKGNLLYPRECWLSLEESLGGRDPICGKTDTPTILLDATREFVGISAVFYAAEACGCHEKILPKCDFLDILHKKVEGMLAQEGETVLKDVFSEELYDEGIFSKGARNKCTKSPLLGAKKFPPSPS